MKVEFRQGMASFLQWNYGKRLTIDFEERIRRGIDAIEYAYSIVHRDENIKDEMDIKMLGWDCDSILIMNPNIILR